MKDRNGKRFLLLMAAATVIVLGTVLLSLALYYRHAQPRTVTIGVLFTMSEQIGIYGKWIRSGVEMAVEDINTSGGAAGYRFKAIFADDKSRPLYAGRLAEKLISKDGAHFLLGVINSDVALKVNDISYKYQKIFMGTSHAASVFMMEHFQPYHFNDRKNTFQLMAAGALFLKDLKRTKPWNSIVFIGPDNHYGRLGCEELLYNLNRFRVDHRLIATYWPRIYTKDYAAFITAILRDNPDILVIELYGEDFRRFIQQANRQDMFSRIQPCAFLAGGHYDNLSMLKDEMPLGMYVSGANFVNWPETDLQQELMERARRKTGEYPSVVFADAYYGVQLLAQAVGEVGNPHDTAALVKSLEGMKIRMSHDPKGFVSFMDPATHQIVQMAAVGEVMENKNYPPAIRMPGNWKVFSAEALLPPAEYVRERRKNAFVKGAHTTSPAPGKTPAADPLRP